MLRNAGAPAYAAPMNPRRDALPVRPLPVAPADVADHIVSAVWRTMVRQGHDADREDARQLAALVIAATAATPARRDTPVP